MKLTKAQEFMKETFAQTSDKVEISSVNDVNLSDHVVFKSGAEEGLFGTVLGKRDNLLDIRVGSATRVGVKPQDLWKLIKTGV